MEVGSQFGGANGYRKTYWYACYEYKYAPTTDHWLSSGSGVSGIPFVFVVTKKDASVEISINRGEKEWRTHESND